MIKVFSYLSTYVGIIGSEKKEAFEDFERWPDGVVPASLRLVFRAPVKDAEELSITFTSRQVVYDFATKLCEVFPGVKEKIFKSEHHYPDTIKVRAGMADSGSFLNFSAVRTEGNFIVGLSQDQIVNLVSGLISVAMEIWKEEAGAEAK